MSAATRNVNQAAKRPRTTSNRLINTSAAARQPTATNSATDAVGNARNRRPNAVGSGASTPGICNCSTSSIRIRVK